MNWITNYVKPKLQDFVGKKEVPDNLWETCPKCSQMLLKKELITNQFVCKHCDHHFRISSKDLTVSSIDTYLPSSPVNCAATKNGWDKNFSIFLARSTVFLSSSDNSSNPKIAMMS